MIALFLLVIFITLAFCFISAIALKIFVDSKNKDGDFGINFSLPNCPVCDERVPSFRTPTSLNQAFWGGWTCQNCGCEMDKWGKELEEREKVLIENRPNEEYKTFHDKDGKTPLEKVFEENKG